MTIKEIAKYYEILKRMLINDLRVDGDKLVNSSSFNLGSLGIDLSEETSTEETETNIKTVAINVEKTGASSSFPGSTYVLFSPKYRNLPATIDGHSMTARRVEGKIYHYVTTSLIDKGSIRLAGTDVVYTASIRLEEDPTAGTTKYPCRYHGRHNGDRPHFYVGPHFVGNVRVVVDGCIDKTVYFDGKRYPVGSEGQSGMDLLIKHSDAGMEPIAIIIKSSCKATSCSIYR